MKNYLKIKLPIYQFNGKIKVDLIKNLKMYSDSIISLKEIKYE